MKYPAVLLFGPPGSGKGTVGKILAQAGHHVHLSSGDVFRGLLHESEMGQLVYSYTSKGLLVPDDVTIQIVGHYIEGLVAANRYFPEKQFLFLDGIPRTSAQVGMLEPMIDVKQVIVLEAKNPEVLIARLQKRAIIEGRKDDADVETLKTRMEVYQKQTAQVLSCYPKELISYFNADQRPLSVLRDILVKLSDTLTYGF